MNYAHENKIAVQRAQGLAGFPVAKGEICEDPGSRTILQNLDRRIERAEAERNRLLAIKEKLSQPGNIMNLTISELRQAMDY